MNNYRLNSILALLFLSFFSCKSQSVQFVYENKSIVLNEMEKRFDVEEKFNVFFESGFINEEVEVLIDSKKEYYDVLTTDNVIGLAKYYSFRELPKKNLKIILPKTNINLEIVNIKGYKYVYINKKEKKYFVTISNRPHFYY